MRILIVGAGALGCLFGALLSRRADVCVLTHWREQGEALRRDGVTLESDGRTAARAHEVKVALDESELPWMPDVVIVCVKVYDTEEKLGRLLPCIGEAPVVSIQNGLAQLEIMRTLVGADRSCMAPTYQAATKLRAGVIRHSANGPTSVWSESAVPDAVHRLVDVMAALDMPAVVSPDGRRASWEKLIVTAGINALCALLRIPVGALTQSEHAMSLAHALAEEARLLASEEGQEFSAGEIRANVERAIALTARNHSSMLQDVLAGRPTEVEFVNGFVDRRSRQLGLAAPRNAAICSCVAALTEVASARV